MTTEEDKTEVKDNDVVSILYGFADGLIAVVLVGLFLCWLLGYLLINSILVIYFKTYIWSCFINRWLYFSKKKINVNIIFNVVTCLEGYRIDIWWYWTFVKPFVISQADKMQKFVSAEGICVFPLSVFCSKALQKLITKRNTKKPLKFKTLSFKDLKILLKHLFVCRCVFMKFSVFCLNNILLFVTSFSSLNTKN